MKLNQIENIIADQNAARENQIEREATHIINEIVGLKQELAKVTKLTNEQIDKLRAELKALEVTPVEVSDVLGEVVGEV